MLGLENAPSVVESASLIGVVLVEAIVLYVGYGLVEEALGGTVVERIKQT